MDTLLSMRVFARIVETGSFTRAAELTGLTTPRVSALLRQLEQHLRCKLINRTTRRVSPTEDGSMYYQRCVAVLDEIDDMEASLSRARVAPKGKLRVNMPTAMAKRIVIPALPDFVGRFADISIDLAVARRTRRESAHSHNSSFSAVGWEPSSCCPLKLRATQSGVARSSHSVLTCSCIGCI